MFGKSRIDDAFCSQMSRVRLPPQRMIRVVALIWHALSYLAAAAPSQKPLQEGPCSPRVRRIYRKTTRARFKAGPPEHTPRSCSTMATLPRGSTAAAAGGAGAGDHEGRDIETSAERPHDNEDLTSTASSQTSQASGSDDQHEMQDAAGPARKERPASSVFGPTPEPQGEPSTTAAASATRRVIADVEADGPSDEDNFSLDREQNVAPQLGISEREHEPTHPEGDPRLSLQPPPPQPPGTDPSSSNAPSSSHLLSGADQDSRGDRAQASMSARSTTPGTDDGADLANPAGRLMGVPQSHSDGGESTQASPGIESPTASRRRTDTLSEGSDSAQPSSPAQSHEEAALAEFALPRWQPDAEVTYCAICQRQFSFFVRKHHCRFVICASRRSD